VRAPRLSTTILAARPLLRTGATNVMHTQDRGTIFAHFRSHFVVAKALNPWRGRSMLQLVCPKCGELIVVSVDAGANPVCCTNCGRTFRSRPDPLSGSPSLRIVMGGLVSLAVYLGIGFVRRAEIDLQSKPHDLAMNASIVAKSGSDGLPHHATGDTSLRITPARLSSPSPEPQTRTRQSSEQSVAQ
jgi:hypothetical protein